MTNINGLPTESDEPLAGLFGNRRAIVRQIAEGMALKGVLNSIVDLLERELPGSLCSVLLLDTAGERLLLGAAPNLPAFYNQAVHGLKIGPGVGSCGTAAYTGETVIVEDINVHPYWVAYVALARQAGVTSCWSEPIRSSEGKTLGTLAIYYATARSPTKSEWEAISYSASLASIAIERTRSEEAVRDSQRMLRMVMDNIPLGVFWKDNQSKYLGCNQVVAKSFGLRSSDEIVGKTDRDLTSLTPEQAAFFVAKDRQVIESNTPEYGILEPANLASGQQIWLETNKIPMRDADGNVIGVLGTWQDVTDRKLGQEALSRSEEKYRDLVETSHDLIWSVNAEGRWTFVNRRGALAIYDYEPEEMLGRPFTEFETAEQAKIDLEVFSRIKAGQPAFQYETVHLRKDGSPVYVSFNAIPLHSADGRLLGTTGTATDITRRKRLEEDLRKQHLQLRLILEQARTVLWTTDTRLILNFTEGGALKDYGVQPRDAEGLSLQELLQTNDPDHYVIKAHRATLQGASSHYETEWVGRLLDVHVEPMRDLSGAIVGCVGIGLDITDRRKAEEEQRRLEQRLQEAQRLESIGVLAGGIAHDFNNLLTAILGYSDLALMELPAESRVRDRIEQVIVGATRAAELANQMLAYAGKSKPVLAPLILSDLARNSAELLRVSISKSATLDFKIDEVPLIEGDASQLRQVVMNLILNASDALGDTSGVITLRVDVRPWQGELPTGVYRNRELPDGEYVVLEVADTGCGMPLNVIERIFEPFFTTKFTGRGLGLAVVQRIIRHHHGAIQIQSEIGKGTRFQVFFPYSGAESAVTDTLPDRETWIGAGKLLIVDDEPFVRDLAKQMLESMGFEVLSAENGEQAVRLFQVHSDAVRAVLLDLIMPGMDGASTFAELQRIRSDVPVIVCSGCGEEEAARRFGGRHFTEYVVKPFRSDHLRRALRATLGDDQAPKT